MYKCLALLIAFFLLVSTAGAQVKGSLVPNNFLPEAKTRAETAVALPVAVKESSGLIKLGGYLYTHNDDTDTHLYALDTLTGAVDHKILVSNAVNRDWEEIAQDSAYIYIGDFGNNVKGNRKDLAVLRIPKDSLVNSSVAADFIYFSYSDQTDFKARGSLDTDFDCEAMIAGRDSIYLFTKQWISKKTGVYALPKQPGIYTAKYKQTFDTDGLITGATWLEDKRLIVLCGYSGMLKPFLYLLYDYSGTDFFSGKKQKIKLSEGMLQAEGIATTNGLDYFITNESFTKKPLINSPQRLHYINLSAYLGDYLKSLR